jgi:hypothetical protein
MYTVGMPFNSGEGRVGSTWRYENGERNERQTERA